MAFEQNEYTFPDEADTPELEIEIEDDTPEEDRGREPMPANIVEELDQDELGEYDAKAKEKLRQLKKVWHDERRAKEQTQREHQEAVNIAKALYEENRRMKNAINNGETEYIATAKSAAELELNMAKKAYKEAYEAGDADALVEAQQQLNFANLKAIRANNLQATPLQADENVVQRLQEVPVQPQNQAPQPDEKAVAWQKRNSWFGSDPEMTATALGLHEKLANEGVDIGSDEYYSALDKTMRKRYSEFFAPARAKTSTVVASVNRSTSANKIRLTQSQFQLAKRLGISPEQYAKELIKLENK